MAMIASISVKKVKTMKETLTVSIAQSGYCVFRLLGCGLYSDPMNGFPVND